MAYLPAFQKQLNGTALGSVSCTCYAGAMVGDYHTIGAKVPTGNAVRILTGDKTGGTTLEQVDAALRKGWAIDLDSRVGSEAVSWDYFRAQINRGKAAILQLGYRPIRDSRFRGSETFAGNHAIGVMPGWIGMDPLADGRRSGIYKYHGEAYPEALLKLAASQLEVVPGRLAGPNVWAAFSRDNTTTWKATVKPTPPATTYPIYFYTVAGGLITGRSVKRTAGINAACTAPRLYRAAAGVPIPAKSLVQLTEGVHKGVYIQATFATEVP